MTVVVTYLASDTAKNRRRLRRAAERDGLSADDRLARKIAVASAGCALTVARATSSPSLRDKQEGGSCCMADVSLYYAGHRKTCEVTAQ